MRISAKRAADAVVDLPGRPGSIERPEPGGLDRQGLRYVREFRRRDDPFPDAEVDWMETTGHSLFLSVKAGRANGNYLTYQSIADAQPGSTIDSEILRWATVIRGYDKPVNFAFNPKPETVTHSGTPTQSSWPTARSSRCCAQRTSPTCASPWSTPFEISVASTDVKYAPNYYPGDDYVDVIGVDAYGRTVGRSGGCESRFSGGRPQRIGLD